MGQGMAGNQVRLLRPADTLMMERLSAALWRHRGLSGSLLLTPPMGWFVLIYIPALAVLLITSLWTVDAFTGVIEHTWTLENFRYMLTSPVYQAVILRTIGMAAAVTVTDIILAFPFAYYAARIASRRGRMLMFAFMLLPLWAMFVGPIYAWRLILAKQGIFNWLLIQVGLPPANIGYTNWAVWIIFSYLWLPFVVAPIYAAVEKIPGSFLEASQDMGARGWRTFAKVIMPLALPGIIAGSIFSFSLTLGGYIVPNLAGGPGSDLLGNVIFTNVGAANNVPFAATLAVVPVVVMAFYLLVARRLGAFDMM